jgi:SAM-dependent methyltransferase
MNQPPANRFEDFFADDGYVRLKNLLYNYLLRKSAVNRSLLGLERGPILEVGSGLSPMVTDTDRVTYSELSFAALRTLKLSRGRGCFVVADALHLPFKREAFSLVVCSEVLEHLPDDRTALAEMAGVLRPGGSLILTVPHRQGYFAVDDRFVHHLRRYEIAALEQMLRATGLIPREIRNVLGPLEKLLMMTVTGILSLRPSHAGSGGGAAFRSAGSPLTLSLFKWFNRLLLGVVWLDARWSPRLLASVVLVRSVKE